MVVTKVMVLAKTAWFDDVTLPQPNISPMHSLVATIDNETVDVNFDMKTKAHLVTHIAILGFGVVTKVRRGENRGKDLQHDFVVIGYKKAKMDKGSVFISANVTLPKTVDINTSRKSVVIWVSRQNDPTPLQVLGSWL